MSNPFPITIAGHRFDTPQSLADDIAQRAVDRVIPERGLDPWDWYQRWMREDSSGATQEAVLAACALIIANSNDGDALNHAIHLTGSAGAPATLRCLMDRLATANIPASRWYGDADTISQHALSAISFGVVTKLPEQKSRLAWLFEVHGAFYHAASLFLSGGTPDPAVVGLVQRWAASTDVDPTEASALGSTATFYPDLVIPLAHALSRADDEPKAAFQAQVDAHLPEQSAAVAAALARQ